MAISAPALDNLQIRLFHTDFLLLQAGAWFSPDVRSAYWRFYWNEDPGGHLDSAGTTLSLEAGTAYFVPAQVLFTCRNTEPMRHFYIHFDVLGLPAPMLRQVFSTPLALPRDKALECAVRSLLKGHFPLTWAGNSGVAVAGQCALKAVVLTALSLALGQQAHTWEKALQGFEEEAEMLAPALAAIETELAAELGNPRLAALCHLSEDHFIRRFRLAMHQTPAAYVQERRVERAAQLLLFSSDSLEQIAATTGFPNRHYFTRVFTHHFGLPPAAYRKRGRSRPQGQPKGENGT